MTVDDRFSAERFRALGTDDPRPAVDLILELQEAIEAELRPVVTSKMAEIAARLNGMGHQLVLYEDDDTEVGYHDEVDVPEGEHCWLRINADWVGSAGWLGFSSSSLDEAHQRTAEALPMWEIRLLIESDDPAERERITDSLANILCPLPVSDHDECPTPWFVVATPLEHLDEEEAERWRDVLNRE